MGVVRVGLRFSACVVDGSAIETKSKVRPKKKFARAGGHLERGGGTSRTTTLTSEKSRSDGRRLVT